MRKVNYLNNKDILHEIHKSKSTFCSFTLPEYSEYDVIVDGIEVGTDAITEKALQKGKENRAKSLTQAETEKRKEMGLKGKADDVDPNSIEDHEIIFRVMMFDHIPDEPDRKKNPKTVADTKVKLNFPPFQHWKYTEDGELVCVGKSHWIGGMANGYFSKDHGRVTNKLANMWLKLVDRYATRGNVRGYSYNDEMKGQATLQLAQIGLQFNEAKSDNPFSYYTAVTTNSFVKVINSEKKAQATRDDILQSHNLDPSHTRLHDAEWESSVRRFNENKNKSMNK